MPYPVFVAGQRLTAGLLTEMQPVTVRKLASQQIASSTTLANDNELFVTLEAGATYEMNGLFLYAAHSSGDFKIGFAGPTNSLIEYTAYGLLSGSTGTSGNVSFVHYWFGNQPIFGGAGAENTTALAATVRGFISAGDGGIFRLQWAQGTSQLVATILKVNSFLTFRRLS